MSVCTVIGSLYINRDRERRRLRTEFRGMSKLAISQVRKSHYYTGGRECTRWSMYKVLKNYGLKSMPRVVGRLLRGHHLSSYPIVHVFV